MDTLPIPHHIHLSRNRRFATDKLGVPVQWRSFYSEDLPNLPNELGGKSLVEIILERDNVLQNIS